MHVHKHTVLIGSKAQSSFAWTGPQTPIKCFPLCRYLTQLQIFQFVTMTLQAVYAYFYSPHPKFVPIVLFFYSQSLLFLFVMFYLQKHGLGSKAKRA